MQSSVCLYLLYFNRSHFPKLQCASEFLLKTQNCSMPTTRGSQQQPPTRSVRSNRLGVLGFPSNTLAPAHAFELLAEGLGTSRRNLRKSGGNPISWMADAIPARRLAGWQHPVTLTPKLGNERLAHPCPTLAQLRVRPRQAPQLQVVDRGDGRLIFFSSRIQDAPPKNVHFPK